MSTDEWNPVLPVKQQLHISWMLTPFMVPPINVPWNLINLSDADICNFSGVFAELTRLLCIFSYYQDFK